MMCHVMNRGYIFVYFQKNAPIMIPDNENGTMIACASNPLYFVPKTQVSALIMMKNNNADE